MTISELIPFFDFKELIRFYSLNKACKVILTPGDPHCLRFDVLFDKRKNEFKLHRPTWKEDIARELAESRSLGKVINVVAQSYLHQVPNTLYGNTYSRYEKGYRQLLGYAGQNVSTWTEDGRYFTRTSIPNSTFDKPLLQLINVCWMDPWVVVEKIPKSWQRINVSINHVYKDHFNMEYGEANVRIWSKDEANEHPQHLHTLSWPLEGWRSKPRNVLVVEPVLTFSPPVGPPTPNEFYYIKLELYSQGNWKSNWMFEGITITKAND